MLQKKELKAVILLGNEGVGKTKFMQRFTRGAFSEANKTTIGADFEVREITIDNNEYVLQIWDTAGQERFKDVGMTFWQKAEVAILTYAVDDKTSFEAIKKWLDEFNNHVSKSTPLVLVALKADLVEKRVITEAQGKELAAELGATFYECSAKTSNNVEAVFIGTLRAKNPELTRQDLRAALQKEREALKKDNEDLKRNIETLEKENGDLKRENESLKKEKEELNNKLAAQDRGLNMLRPKNYEETVIQWQSFFRGITARKEYHQYIIEKAGQIIQKLMVSTKFEVAQSLLNAVSHEEWKMAIKIIRENKNREPIQAPSNLKIQLNDKKSVNEGKEKTLASVSQANDSNQSDEENPANVGKMEI